MIYNILKLMYKIKYDFKNINLLWSIIKKQTIACVSLNWLIIILCDISNLLHQIIIFINHNKILIKKINWKNDIIIKDFIKLIIWNFY